MKFKEVPDIDKELHSPEEMAELLYTYNSSLCIGYLVDCKKCQGTEQSVETFEMYKALTIQVVEHILHAVDAYDIDHQYWTEVLEAAKNLE